MQGAATPAVLSIGIGPQDVRRRMTALTRFLRTASGPVRLEELHEAALACIQDALLADRASILAFDGTGRMRFRAWRNLSDGYRAAVDGHSPWAPDAVEPTPVHVTDVAAATELGELRDVVLAEGIASLSFYPLVHNGRLLGKFMVYRAHPHRPSEEEEAVACTVAATIAFVMGRTAADVARDRSERRLHDVARNVPGVVYRCGARSPWPLLEASEGVHALTGRQAAEILAAGGTWEHIVHEDDVARLRAIRAAAQDGQPVTVEYRIRRPDGSTTWVLDRSRLVTETDGTQCFEGLALDVAERKRYEAELQAANERLDRLRNDFLNMAAHELRTPMTPIVMQLQTLARAGLGEQQQRSLAILERNMNRLNGLVQQLLDVARVQARGVQLERHAVDVGALCREVVDTFDAAARNAGVRLRVEAGERLPFTADGHRLTQVLVNVVSNALRFTPHGGEVAVTATRDGGAILVAVQDTGEGFTAEQREMLFQPFSQAHGPTRGGSGLGLFIARCIVEAHGGSIDATSPGPGKGSTFTVRLPA